jgi:hypothetical protein
LVYCTFGKAFKNLPEMRTSFTLLLTVLLITGLGGCYKCHQLPYLDINKMEISVYNPYRTIFEQDSVSFDSLTIQGTFSGSYYAENSSDPEFTFVNSALATNNCENGKRGSKEIIEQVNVIAVTDFDTEYMAGDTINNIISTTDFQFGPKISLNQLNAQPTPLLNQAFILLTLDRKPTQKKVQFRVAVNLTNGEKYSGETFPITIKQ